VICENRELTQNDLTLSVKDDHGRSFLGKLGVNQLDICCGASG
jgi:hypothetical protein